MEIQWPGTAPPPQGMHSNVPYQIPKSEYVSEYESDDTERPKSKYKFEYESEDTESPHRYRKRYNESGDGRFKERHSRSKKRKKIPTSTPPSSPEFLLRNTREQ